MDTNAVFCPRYPLHLHQYGDDGTFTQLGMSETDAALYTGWLYLPWVIKPFWGPLVDIMKTKRWWTVIMQLCVAVGLAGIALHCRSLRVRKSRPDFTLMSLPLPVLLRFYRFLLGHT